MPSKPWYHKGLRFECTCCGNCCRNHGGYDYVYLSEEDIRAMSQELGLDRREFLSRWCIEDRGWISLRMDDPACPFLQEDNKCGVYGARPLQCRTWPFWSENLKKATWEGPVKDCCPGIGKGELRSAAEVEAIARENDAWTEEG